MIAAVLFALIAVAAFVAGFHFGQATERREQTLLRVSRQMPKMEEAVERAMENIEARARGHATPDSETEHPAGPPPPMPSDKRKRLLPWKKDR